MHRNYFIFERQVSELKNILPGRELQRCFTYRKDELVLQFGGKEGYFLRIGLNLQKPYLLLTPFQNIKDPLTTFFASLQSERLSDMYILPYDKRVILDFSAFSLQAIFYGKRPNVILHDTTGMMIESFKKQSGEPSADRDMPMLLPREFTEEDLNKAITEAYNLHTGRFLAHAFAGFNNQIALEICHRCDLSPDIPIGKVGGEQRKEIIKTVAILLSEFATHPPSLCHNRSGNIFLTISQLNHLDNLTRTETFSDLNKAWEKYLYLSEVVQRYERQYHRAKSTLDKRQAYLERTFRQLHSARDLAARKAEATLKGKLLQAFAHEIPKGEALVSLPNIFTDGSDIVEIKLNPIKSVHENARIYFEKYKDSEERDDQLQIKIDTLEREIAEIREISEKLASRPPQNKLEKIIIDLENRHLIQSENNIKKSDTAFIYSFNRLLLEKKWEVLIGKSAANNDLLTFKFSRKFDLWFHAQSVPGSHVVIRLPNRNEHPPQSVIQDAASIAAYHSSARHSGTVPVNYTEVRYVRKLRKGTPGQVLITNEKTVFVAPKKLV